MIPITCFSGRLVADPELRFTKQGQAVTNFVIAESDSYKNEAGEWVKARELFIPVTIWNEKPRYEGHTPTAWAEMADDLRKGQPVCVEGKLHTVKWETKEGEKRSRVELLAHRIWVAPDTPRATNNTSSGGWNNTKPSGSSTSTGWGTPATPGSEQPPF